MARKLTPTQAAKMLRDFDKQRLAVTLKAFDRGLRKAQRYAVTPPLMEGLGRGKNARPPNPPPGPLGIRTGNLRRSLDIVRATYQGGVFTGGLKASIEYAAIHEFGGIAGRGARIPARPYMGPALRRAQDEIVQEVEIAVAQLAVKVIG